MDTTKRTTPLAFPPPDSAGEPDYSSIGEEICIDRRWEVSTFVRMLRRDPSVPQRILALQGGAGQGKTSLLHRFERICQWSCQQGQQLFYALVDFRDNPLAPPTLVYQLANKMQFNAEAIGGQLLHYIQSFAALRTKAKESNMRPPELTDLTYNFAHCLRDLGRDGVIVLLLDTFEQAGEGGKWFLEHCLPRLSSFDRVIVVLAGRTGLDALRSSNNAIFRDTLAPLLSCEDCQRMAELHYGVSLDEGQARQIIQRYRGDIQHIGIILQVLKDWPDFVSTLNSEQGG